MYLSAEAGEGRLVVRVDGGTGSTVLTATTVATTELATGSTTATAAGGTIAAGTTTRAATAATATSSALGLNVALVDLNDLLDLALTLALGLATGTGDEVLSLILDEGLGGSPLLVLLGTLVGLADAQGLLSLKGELLLSELGEVLRVRDVLVLGLLLLGLLGGLTLGNGLLLLGLSDLLASLLILKLSLALGGTPRLGSLLLGAAIDVVSPCLAHCVFVNGKQLTKQCSCCGGHRRCGRVYRHGHHGRGRCSRHGGRAGHLPRWACHGCGRCRRCGRGKLLDKSSVGGPFKTTRVSHVPASLPLTLARREPEAGALVAGAVPSELRLTVWVDVFSTVLTGAGGAVASSTSLPNVASCQ